MSDRGFAFGDGGFLFFYSIMDQLYPGSKFIMTIRNNTWDLVNSDVKQEIRTRTKVMFVRKIQYLDYTNDICIL